MFQIPTKIESAYTAGNVLTLNQRKIQPALHKAASFDCLWSYSRFLFRHHGTNDNIEPLSLFGFCFSTAFNPPFRQSNNHIHLSFYH